MIDSTLGHRGDWLNLGIIGEGSLVSSGTLVGLPRIMIHAYKNLRLRPSVACWACHGSGQVPTYWTEELPCGNTLATWCEELTYLKRPWCWERLKAGGEGKTEDEMVGWHHRLDRHEFEITLGVGDVQGGRTCCSPRGGKELDVTEQLKRIELNWTELYNYKWRMEFPLVPNWNRNAVLSGIYLIIQHITVT